MSLKDRLNQREPKASIIGTKSDPEPTSLLNRQMERSRGASLEVELELKARIHDNLLDFLDLGRLFEVSREQASRDVAAAARQLLGEEDVLLTYSDRERLIAEIEDEVFGMGPLAPLLRQPDIGDILVNGPHQVYVERNGLLEHSSARFKDEAHLRRILDKIVSEVGRTLSETSPMVDARLPDGSRVNAIIAPLAMNGATVSIRRFPATPLDAQDLVKLGTIDTDVMQFLRAMVKARLNVLVCGGTGSGKTTLLNVLSSWIAPNERIITIEDSAELKLQQSHVVRLETRPPSIEGSGAVAMRDLVINSLRMRPDRIVVGEVRGAEVLDMLQAMNTGHDGSMTTVHANSARDALSRIESLVGISGLRIDPTTCRALVASAFDVIINISRLPNGARRVMSVCEVGEPSVEGPIGLHELIFFGQDGESEDGGTFIGSGIQPSFAGKIVRSGEVMPAKLFDQVRPIE